MVSIIIIHTSAGVQGQGCVHWASTGGVAWFKVMVMRVRCRELGEL